MLLQEYRPFKVNKLLVEQSIKENKSLIVSGVLQRADAKNQNGRVYPREILERERLSLSGLMLTSPMECSSTHPSQASDQHTNESKTHKDTKNEKNRNEINKINFQI